MDPLTALRQAVMAGREGQVSFDKEKKVVTIDGEGYAVDAQTAFRIGKKPGKTYPLLSLWLCWQNRDRPAGDIMRLSTSHRTPFVLVTDKNMLVQYLQGAAEALDYIETGLLKSGAGGAGASSSSGAGSGMGGGAGAGNEHDASSAPGVVPLKRQIAALFGEDGDPAHDAHALEALLRNEIAQPGRSRTTVLQAPGRVRIASWHAQCARTSPGLRAPFVYSCRCCAPAPVSFTTEPSYTSSPLH